MGVPCGPQCKTDSCINIHSTWHAVWLYSLHIATVQTDVVIVTADVFRYQKVKCCPACGKNCTTRNSEVTACKQYYMSHRIVTVIFTLLSRHTQYTKFTVYFFFMYGYGFLSRGFTDRREILHGGSAWSQTGFLPFWGIAPEMAELWVSTGAIWRDLLLAESLKQPINSE